jgi:Tfp pilus assembly protein PilP
MKLTTSILAVALMAGAAWGQNPGAIDNTRGTAKSMPQTKTTETNAVLVAQATKPAPGAPAPAVKPATIPGAQPAAAAPAKAAVAPAPAPASSQNNRLESVNVVHNADDIQIEISSREAVTPKVSKLSSPARLLVELPATVIATSQNKIPVGSAGVKGVRIGMDGKTPPTTSVVVDLEQACGYEMTQGAGNKLVLTLHTQALAKSTPAPVPAKTSAPAPAVQTVAAKPVVAAPTTAPAAKSKPAPATAAVKLAPVPAASTVKPAPATAAVKQADIFVAKKPAVAPPVATAKVAAPKPADKPAAPATTKIAADDKTAAASKIAEAPKPPKPEEKKWAMSGKRDPFFSPVVQQPTGSGCSTGKKCLEIGQINLRGVVKSETGFIAVVTNTLNKAYFLHENDPVFNGYVLRITGDSVVFQETVQDKLGKPLTREIVKRIFTPSV